MTHLRFVLINTTTYESIKGRNWVDNSTHGRPFYVRYPLNCFRFFFRPGVGESPSMGTYGRLATQVRALTFRSLALSIATGQLMEIQGDRRDVPQVACSVTLLYVDGAALP